MELLTSAQNMPLSEENQEWVQEQIRAAIHPNGFRRVADRLRYWGLLGTVVAVIMGLIAIVITLAIFSTNKISAEAEFRTQTRDHLTNIDTKLTAVESALKAIENQLTSQNLTTHAALPLQDFKTSLPALHASLESAQQNNLKISDSVLGELSNKLAATKSTEPSFWPTAATLITYRSSTMVGTPQGWQAFPPCTGVADLDASPNATIQIGDSQGKPIGPKVPIARLGVQDCTIQLDGKTASRWDCTRCVIKYSGGRVSLHDVRLVDCLFIFAIPLNQVPTPSGRAFSEQLLASDFKNVEIRSI